MDSEQSIDERYSTVRRVTLVGSVVDLALGIAKVVVGYLANSQALLADGVHSFSDLVTDMMVLYVARHSHKEADSGHPYGHGRIETLATVVLGASLILVACGIALDALRRLSDGDSLLVPGLWALVVAAVSIISKEWLYHYTLRAARDLKSDLLMANAWHSRSDAISSIVVLIGIVGSLLGYVFLDAVAAVVVAVMIARIGFGLVRSSGMELIDSGLAPEEVERLKGEMMSVNGVRAIHELRTRTSAGRAFVDVHIQVDPRLSVSEGHQIGDTVRQALLADQQQVSDVIVHIDPENDEFVRSSKRLPGRQEFTATLRQCWPELHADQIRHVVLHYLDGKLHAEILLPLSVLSSVEEAPGLISRLRGELDHLDYLDELSIRFEA